MPTEKYKYAIRIIMGIVSSIFIAVLVFIYPVALEMDRANKLSFGSMLFSIITIGSLYTIIFGILLSIYENYLWRLHSIKNDYNGFWKMTITYEFLERGSKSRKRMELPYFFESVFKIEQDIFDLRFSEGFSAPNEIWRDKSLRLVDNGINMSYQVHRTDKTLYDPLPSEMIGYEVIEVTERTNYGRPIYMNGRMHHAAIPNTCLYRGATTYEKITKKQYDDLLQKMRSGEHLTHYQGEQNE